MTLTWDTSSDWNNVSTERFVVSRGSFVELSEGIDSFEDRSAGGSIPSEWQHLNTDADITDITASDGALAIDNDLAHSSGDRDSYSDAAIKADGIGGEQPDKITFAYYEFSSSGGLAFVVTDGNQNRILQCGSSNPGVGYNETGTLVNSPSPEYGEWRRFTIDFDWGAGTYDLLWEDLSGSTANQTVTGVSFMSSASQIDEVYLMSVDGIDWAGGSNATLGGEEYVDEVYGVLRDGWLETDTRSFSEPAEPALSDLVYSLNDGSITLEVTGSPGTSSEETLTQTLDGSTSHNLNWGSSHSDFRVTVQMDVAERNATPPTLSTLNLVEPIPDPPTGVSASPDSPSDVSITWDDPGDSDTGPDSWNIYRATSTGSSLSDYSSVGTTTSIGYTDSGLTNGRQYHYRVTAENNAGESEPSAEVTATTPIPDFALSATPGSRQIDLDWTGDNNPDGTLYVYRDGAQHASLSFDSSSFLDDGLVDGTEFAYHIERDTGDAAATSSTVTPVTDLPAPTLSATFGDRQVSLEWTINDNNESGDIEVYRDGGSLATITDLSTVSYTDSGLLDGKEYAYYLERSTADTTTSTATEVDTTYLPPVEGLAVDSVDGRFVTLSWTDPSNNSAGYRLLLKKPSDGSYSQDGADYDPVAEGGTKTVTSTELLDGQEYTADVETFTADTTTNTR